MVYMMNETMIIENLKLVETFRCRNQVEYDVFCKVSNEKLAYIVENMHHKFFEVYPENTEDSYECDSLETALSYID